jgi:hypothetical protein
MPREQVTAIIVNAHGEVFIGWGMRMSFTPSGWETWYRVPQFAKTKTILKGPGLEWWPWKSTGRCYRTINKPYVFSSREQAETAASKMYAAGRIAVVS